MEIKIVVWHLTEFGVYVKNNFFIRDFHFSSFEVGSKQIILFACVKTIDENDTICLPYVSPEVLFFFYFWYYSFCLLSILSRKALIKGFRGKKSHLDCVLLFFFKHIYKNIFATSQCITVKKLHDLSAYPITALVLATSFFKTLSWINLVLIM